MASEHADDEVHVVEREEGQAPSALSSTTTLSHSASAMSYSKPPTDLKEVLGSEIKCVTQLVPPYNIILTCTNVSKRMAFPCVWQLAQRGP